MICKAFFSTPADPGGAGAMRSIPRRRRDPVKMPASIA
jgi:hypothetical protein